MAKRADVLEFAVLGLLSESPMHGYELRKRLNLVLGSLRAFSYGSLYPCLKDLCAKGWICEDGPAQVETPALSGKRSKIVYKLTAEGKERLTQLLSEAGPSAWEDETFGVHFAFFGQTDPAVRVRILEGRRSRLEERREGVRVTLARTRSRLDRYTLQLQEHGLESVDREVRWLTELIESERRSVAPDPATRQSAPGQSAHRQSAQSPAPPPKGPAAAGPTTTPGRGAP